MATIRSLQSTFESALLSQRTGISQHLLLRRPPLHSFENKLVWASRRWLQSGRANATKFRNLHNPLKGWRQPKRTAFRHQTRPQTNSTSSGSRPSPDPTSQLGSPSHTPSLSERLRKLSREYGWTALGVYLALSALDFPFCFLAVRMLGTDRIGRWEQQIVHGFWRLVSMPFPGGEEQVREVFRKIGEPFQNVMLAVGLRKQPEAPPAEPQKVVVSKAGEAPDGAVLEEKWSWGVEEAEAAHRDRASLATQLALAYAVHKSFIFLRVPLTAAILPRVVKTLRGWGWNIGKRPGKKA